MSHPGDKLLAWIIHGGKDDIEVSSHQGLQPAWGNCCVRPEQKVVREPMQASVLSLLYAVSCARSADNGCASRALRSAGAACAGHRTAAPRG